MKRITLFTTALVALVLGVLIAGCARGTDILPAVTLDGTSWTLVQILGEDLIAKTEITLAFEEGQVAGAAGCNRYFGAASVDGDKLSIGPVGSTEMFCVDPEGVMDQETSYLKSLAVVAGYRFEAGKLILLDQTGQPVLAFVAATP